MDKQVKECHERLQIQRCRVDKEGKLLETGIEKIETLLARSTSAEIVQARLDKSLNATLEEDVSDSLDQVDCDLEGLRRFMFAENESLMTKTVY